MIDVVLHPLRRCIERLLLTTTLVLVGIGAAQDVPTVETDNPITLRWAVPGNPAEVAVYQALADTFMAANPNITVQLERDASDFDRILTLIAAGEEPDLLFFVINNWPQVAGRGVLEPLDDYIAQDDFDLSDFYPQIIAPYRFDGERFGEGALYGLPKEIAVRAFYYHKDLWAEAGLAEPDPNERLSWDEFREALQALTRSEGRRTAQYGLVSDAWWGIWSIWVWANGGELVDDPWNPTRATLDDPRVIEAMEWFVSLATEDGVLVPGAVTAEQSSNDVFIGKRAGVFYSGRWQVPSYREAGLDFEVMPTPAGEAGPAQLLTGSIFGISANSEQKEAAWALLSYISSPAGQREMTELGILLPALRSVAESDSFLASTPPMNNQVFLDDLEYARVMPLHPALPQMNQILIDQMQLALAGDKAVADALRDANEQINALLEE